MRQALSCIKRVVIAGLAAIAWSASAGTVTYYHNDLVGSPVAATNEGGQVVWRENYRPYGERLTQDSAANDNSMWYASRRQDSQTGLVYMGARYYDPVLGRFMGVDALKFRENNIHSFNRYAYANNNPYRYVDPDGKNAASLARVVLVTSFDAANALGAARLGSTIGLGLWWIFNAEADSEKGATKPSDTAAPQAPARPQGVPETWVEQPTRDGNGREWVNPENPHDRVRSMPGNPDSANPAQREPYVRDVRNGNQWLDRNGDRVEGREGRNSPTTHIPTKDYKFPE